MLRTSGNMSIDVIYVNIDELCRFCLSENRGNGKCSLNHDNDSARKGFYQLTGTEVFKKRTFTSKICNNYNLF